MSEQDIVTRLAKPKRKGILGLIFSRFFIIVLLILIEAAVVILPGILLTTYLHHFYIVLALLSVVILIYLFNSKMDSSAKLTWMLCIAVLQIAGALMLLFTKLNAGQRMVKERSEKMVAKTKDAIRQDPEVSARLRDEDSYTDDLLTYLNRSGCFPAFAKTETTYFPSGEKKFEAMLEELAKAEEYMKTGAATIFAAHEEDVLVGWVWSHPIERFNKTRLHIAEIAIDERFRGKGLGSELLSFVENYAAENGFEEMDLMVTAENDAAVEFYKKDGFEAERYLMKKVL